MNNQNLDEKSANFDNPNPNINPKISRDYDETPLIIKDELASAEILSAAAVRKLFFSQYDMAYSNAVGFIVFYFFLI